MWRDSGKPLVAIVPEFDDYLRPAEARERFAAIPQAEVVAVPDGKHLWVGQAETVLDLIVERLNPAAAPLPDTWDGPMEHEAPRIHGTTASRARLLRRRRLGGVLFAEEDLANEEQDRGGRRDGEHRTDDAHQAAADEHRDHGEHAGDVRPTSA